MLILSSKPKEGNTDSKKLACFDHQIACLRIPGCIETATGQQNRRESRKKNTKLVVAYLFSKNVQWKYYLPGTDNVINRPRSRRSIISSYSRLINEIYSV